MKLIIPLVSFIFLFLFAGCIEIITLVKVNSDGSGTVEETVLMSKDIVDMIRELANSMPPDSGEEKEEFNLFNEEELRGQAAAFGEGVEYLNGKEISDDSKEGFSAVYSFKDLNQLRINQNPNAKLPLGAIEENDEVQEELVTFRFVKNKNSEITINFTSLKPETIMDEIAKDETAAADADSMITDTTFSEVAKFLQDMKIMLAIEPDGKITETNATYINGNIITLFDIDFNELLSNKEKFEEFNKLQPQTFEDFKQIVRDIPGIKVELNQPLIIKFQ